MQLNWYRDQVKDQLTGYGLLELELSDDAIDKIILSALREIGRYYNETELVEANALNCIDIAQLEEEKNIKISSINKLRHTTGGAFGAPTETAMSDPIYMSMGQVGNFGELTDQYLQLHLRKEIVNLANPDLKFKFDRKERKLYVTYSAGQPSRITIEYIPRIESVEDIVEDFGVDILVRLSVALAKVAIGRIRTRFVQSSPLWSDDGEKMLSEGQEELKALRERLISNDDVITPIS